MQTVETLNEGLKRAYILTIPAKEISSKVDAEVAKAAPQIKMPGFRPGKVPANLIKKMHGPAMEREALNTAVQEGVQSLMADKQLRPAMQPEVSLDEDYEPGKDIEVKVALEVLPDVPAPQIDKITLERLTVGAADSEIDTQLARFAEGQKSWEDAKEDHPAVEGDQVTIDFVGKTLDGVAFPGGTGTDMVVELGAGRLIPGFESQIEGAKLGEERQLKVKFPKDYGEKSLAGKEATFDITVKAVKVSKDAVVDEALATSLGLESLEKLRELFKGQVEQELNGLTRTYMKRKLLDQLADTHHFDVPPSMVEAEFAQIWAQLEHEASHEEDQAAALAEMENDRDDYHSIAERRVRLGLLLSEIGRQNNIEISSQEMQRLALQAAQQYQPQDRQRFMEYVTQDPVAAAQLRAPLYEDKVVDFLFEKATITDREVTRAELEAAIEDVEGSDVKSHVHGPDCGHDHGHDHDHAEAKPAKAKKAAPKPAEAAAEEASVQTKPAPKKKAALKQASAEEAPELAADAPAAEKPKAKRAAKPKAEA